MASTIIQSVPVITGKRKRGECQEEQQQLHHPYDPTPRGVWDAKCVEEIVIANDHNAIQTITQVVGLDMKYTTVPMSVLSMFHLRHLNLSGNVISRLPPELGDLTSLKKIDLSHNIIQFIPREYANLTNLEDLDLSHNRLVIFPTGAIVGMQSLRYLCLANNAFDLEFEGHVKEWTRANPLMNLEWLDMEHCCIDHIPKAFLRMLPNLLHLYLCHNSIERFPAAIATESHRHLKTLMLCHNEISTLPKTIGNLASLQYLSLANNALTKLPPAMGNLTNLLGLDLESNKLTQLPGSLITLATRRDLDSIFLGGNEACLRRNGGLECLKRPNPSADIHIYNVTPGRTLEWYHRCCLCSYGQRRTK